MVDIPREGREGSDTAIEKALIPATVIENSANPDHLSANLVDIALCGGTMTASLLPSSGLVKSNRL